MADDLRKMITKANELILFNKQQERSIDKVKQQLNMLVNYSEKTSMEWFNKKIANKNNKNMLGITLNYKNTNEYFKELTEHRLPQIKVLSIQNIKETNYEELWRFLSKSFPIRLEKLELEFSFKAFFDLSLILMDLKVALRCLTRKLRIYRASLTNKSLKQLISDSSHLEIVIFWSWNIEIDQKLEFDSDVSYDIESLKFYYSPDHRADYNQEIAKNVVKAISKSSLAQSLKYIWFADYDGVNESYLSELLQKYSLNNLVVKKMF